MDGMFFCIFLIHLKLEWKLCRLVCQLSSNGFPIYSTKISVLTSYANCHLMVFIQHNVFDQNIGSDFICQLTSNGLSNCNNPNIQHNVFDKNIGSTSDFQLNPESQLEFPKILCRHTLVWSESILTESMLHLHR